MPGRCRNRKNASTYTWSFVSRPGGSSASLSNRDKSAPSFSPDVGGDYVIRLVINDGQGDAEDEAEVTITVALLD